MLHIQKWIRDLFLTYNMNFISTSLFSILIKYFNCSFFILSIIQWVRRRRNTFKEEEKKSKFRKAKRSHCWIVYTKGINLLAGFFLIYVNTIIIIIFFNWIACFFKVNNSYFYVRSLFFSFLLLDTLKLLFILFNIKMVFGTFFWTWYISIIVLYFFFV